MNTTGMTNLMIDLFKAEINGTKWQTKQEPDNEINAYVRE